MISGDWYSAVNVASTRISGESSCAARNAVVPTVSIPRVGSAAPSYSSAEIVIGRRVGCCNETRMPFSIGSSFQRPLVSNSATRRFPRPMQITATSGASSLARFIHGVTSRGNTSGVNSKESKTNSAAIREPLAGSRNVIGRALAFGFEKRRKTRVVVAAPRVETLEECQRCVVHVQADVLQKNDNDWNISFVF